MNLSTTCKQKIPSTILRNMAGKRNGMRNQLKSIQNKLQTMRNEPDLYSDAERIEITLALRHCQRALAKWNTHFMKENYESVNK